MPAARSFYQTLTAAVADVATYGYDSAERLQHWLGEIRAAAERDLVSEEELEREVRRQLGAVYDRMVVRGGLLGTVPVGRFTLERVKPRLRDALDRAILANASLIRMNRAAAIDQTLRRFSGWATSIPPGGSPAEGRRVVKGDLRQAMARTPYEVRRCANDQAHKLAASLSSILATDGGAIAGVWERHYTRYPRDIHVARAGRVYLVRDSWAHQRGLVRPSPDGYVDEHEMPAQLISCRCTYRWLFNLRQLPDAMLTAEGRAALTEARAAIAA